MNMKVAVALVVTADDESETGSCVFEVDEAAAVKTATDEALARFTDNIGDLSSAHRIVVHILELPVPGLRISTFQTSIPDAPEEPATDVTATVA
jgi:hypothetical protein